MLNIFREASFQAWPHIFPHVNFFNHGCTLLIKLPQRGELLSAVITGRLVTAPRTAALRQARSCGVGWDRWYPLWEGWRGESGTDRANAPAPENSHSRELAVNSWLVPAWWLENRTQIMGPGLLQPRICSSQRVHILTAMTEMSCWAVLH